MIRFRAGPFLGRLNAPDVVRGLAANQMGCKFVLLSFASNFSALRQPQQTQECDAGQFFARHTDCCHAGVSKRAELYVVVAEHGQISRQIEAHLMRCLHRPERGEIVRANYGAEPWKQVQQVPYRLIAAGRSVIRPEDVPWVGG